MEVDPEITGAGPDAAAALTRDLDVAIAAGGNGSLDLEENALVIASGDSGSTAGAGDLDHTSRGVNFRRGIAGRAQEIDAVVVGPIAGAAGALNGHGAAAARRDAGG